MRYDDNSRRLKVEYNNPELKEDRAYNPIKIEFTTGKIRSYGHNHKATEIKIMDYKVKVYNEEGYDMQRYVYLDLNELKILQTPRLTEIEKIYDSSTGDVYYDRNSFVSFFNSLRWEENDGRVYEKDTE